MPLPTLYPGHDPTTTPGTNLIATFGSGMSGGGPSGGGLTPNPIRPGINIAFGSNLSDNAPLWQLLESLGPTA